MHAAIYRVQTDTRADDIVRLGYQELTAQAKKMPGFISHTSIRFDDGTGIIIALFETEAQLQHFHHVGMDWVKQRVAARHGPPYDQPPTFQFGRVTGHVTHSGEHLDIQP